MENINFYPIHSEKISWTIFGDMIVVINLSDGYCYTLNTIACVIWKLCNGKKSLRDIVKNITKEYNVNQKTAFEDVEDFSKRLAKVGLLRFSRQKTK